MTSFIKKHRLYMVDAYVTYFNGARFPKEYLSASLTDVLREQAPEIEEMTRIALLLACMGLFGLASFTSENRTKEIGIRKANGATTSAVMRLLLTSYTKWLTIAFLIALPIALLAGKNFQGRFNFHASMPLWAFLAGPLISFAVALITVTSQTWNVANREPVKSLRYE